MLDIVLFLSLPLPPPFFTLLFNQNFFFIDASVCCSIAAARSKVNIFLFLEDETSYDR